MFSWLKRSLQRITESSAPAEEVRPAVRRISRSEHIISRSNISENALKVLYRLRKAGYEGYLVGGGVRDLLLGREPKDFDIATSAEPEEVRQLFRNCRLIGRRFRLAHVTFGSEIIEVATFRGPGVAAGEEESPRSENNGILLHDNVYGTLEEDAWRRDFTVNALYYDINDFSVVDHTGGMADLEAGRLRIIGDPFIRFREDPVRMLRAVRFAGKLGFRIEERCEQAIYQLGHLIAEVPPARLFDEILKLFLAGYAVETYELLRHYRLFGHLFPDTEVALEHEVEHFPHTLVAHALENTDERIESGRPVTPAFLFAALLWDAVQEESERLQQEEACSPIEALQRAGDTAVARQNGRVAFPKRFSLQAREIWVMQERLTRRGSAALRMLENPRFRAAYDFLLLRAQSGEEVGELADWWTELQGADPEQQRALIANSRSNNKPRSNRRRRRRGRRRSGDPAGTTDSTNPS